MSDKTHMHGDGESDSVIVPAKQPNKSGEPPAEAVEGRTLTKENMDQPNQYRTQKRKSWSSRLARVREAARKDKKIRFTALLHHVTVDVLRDSYYALKRGAAPGVDGVTWQEYGKDLEERLRNLQGRIHRGAYRALPSLRSWIPKPDGRQRPLGIAALEDKVVQHAVGRVLNQIWEEDFLGFSYGFRPGRSQHDALDALWVGITRKKVNWILDLDIRSFFDQVRHDWMIKFVEHRVGDKRIIRLIQKWLKAGVMEQGRWFETVEGTPQGSVISPILANLYLHFVLDLWVHQWRHRQAKGDVIAVRYADDAVLGFQHRNEAELHPEKTRLIEFGRYATERRKARGEGKPETFDFLGFTHISGTTRKAGRFTIRRQTNRKRMTAKLKEIRAQLKVRRHESHVKTVKWLQSVVRGYFQYYAIPDNQARLEAFRQEVLRMWLDQLRRRSQRSRWNWERFMKRLGHLLPEIRVLHPYPTVRFDAKYPR
jgi:group II intron reverse transcriptase/maturase